MGIIGNGVIGLLTLVMTKDGDILPSEYVFGIGISVSVVGLLTCKCLVEPSLGIYVRDNHCRQG
jgi:hypothetical protein